MIAGFLDFLGGLVVEDADGSEEHPFAGGVGLLERVKGWQRRERTSVRGSVSGDLVVADQVKLDGALTVVNVVSLLNRLGTDVVIILGQHCGQVELVPDLNFLALHDHGLTAGDTGGVRDLAPEESAGLAVEGSLVRGLRSTKVGVLIDLVTGGDDV